VDEHDRDEGPLDGALLVDGAREDDDASFDEDGKADYAKEILEGILDRMGLLAEVEIRQRQRLVLRHDQLRRARRPLNRAHLAIRRE